jgi:hypothetical protein
MAWSLFSRLLLSLLFLLFRRPRLELQCMNAAFLRHLIFEKRIDHAVSSGLHFRLESVGCDDDTSQVSSARVIGICARLPEVCLPNLSVIVPYVGFGSYTSLLVTPCIAL